MPQRTLSEAEFNAVRDQVLHAAPPGLSEDDFNRYIGRAVDSAVSDAENTPKLEGSAISRFAEGAWKNLNPIAAVSGLAQAVRHPIDTVSNVVAAQGAELSKAKDAFQHGQYTEAAGRAAAGALPILGPMAAAAGERIGSGDVAGGLGEAAGILAPFGALDAARSLGKAWGVVPKTTREVVAGRLENIASEKVANVMTPQVGANKVRFGNQAAAVAPDLLKAGDVQGFSRDALQSHLEGRLAESQAALDTAADSRLAARSFPTQPLINDLLAKRQRLMAEAVDASKSTPIQVSKTSPILDAQGKPIVTTTTNAEPLGRSVEPGPNAPRIAAIDQAIGELKQLGPVARYEPLRRLRAAWDGPANIKYNPSMTQDFLKEQGYANGAADVTGTLREGLAKFDPETAAANADYSLYKKATDVLAATEEVQRTRPKVGRQIMARLTGSVIGEQAAGVPGAAAGFVLGPVLDHAVSSGVTTKLQTAKLLQNLADGIRRGDTGQVMAMSSRLKALIRSTRAAGIGIDQATASPTESAVPSPTP